MGRKIYGESVQGASHIRSGVVCQDSYKQVQVSDDRKVWLLGMKKKIWRLGFLLLESKSERV